MLVVPVHRRRERWLLYPDVRSTVSGCTSVAALHLFDVTLTCLLLALPAPSHLGLRCVHAGGCIHRAIMICLLSDLQLDLFVCVEAVHAVVTGGAAL